MKTQNLLLILLLFTINCSPIRDYPEGLANCESIRIKNQKSNPGKYIYTSPQCLIGYHIPNFEAHTFSGDKIHSKSLEGKPSIINFWFIDCKPCVEEIPLFNDLVAEIDPTRVNFIAIGRDGMKEQEKFLKKTPWNFEHLENGELLIENVFQHSWGYPKTFLIDKKGIIVSVYGGLAFKDRMSLLKSKIVELLEDK